jgi:prepilin-type N-terminal cleavage/methylation domain-containing protein
MALARYKFNNARRARRDAGFSLVETMVATAILATAIVSLAQLFVISVKTNNAAKNGSFAAVLAQQKMEQLRGLTWGFDTLGLPVSDVTTDTSVVPETPTGGTGLAPSPTNTLQASTLGYVDYLDQWGNSLGGGTNIPANTSYIRRWMVEPIPTNPNNTIVLHVLVTRRFDRGTANAGSVQRLPEEARLVTVKTRKAQ